MPETRHELAIGESVVIDDYLLTVEDIRGEEVVFRMERIPNGQATSDASLASETAWEPEAGLAAGDALAGERLGEVRPDKTDLSTGRSAARFRPR
ncbi:MAG: hypothetical protein ACK5EA_13160 [Planctomycetaceae bacterium]|jgi:hypothetical protein